MAADIPLTMDPAAYALLVEGGVDDRLARHIASLFVRDPLVIFSEKIQQVDDESEWWCHDDDERWPRVHCAPAAVCVRALPVPVPALPFVLPPLSSHGVRLPPLLRPPPPRPAGASDHFENIQSTNWRSVRWKPPPPDPKIDMG